MKNTKKKLTIGQICAHLDHYLGHAVTLEGKFLGWQQGDHQFPAGAEDRPDSKSDWMVATGKDCLYVTGGAPTDVSPANPEDNGCRIEITGIVARGKTGGVRLEFLRGHRLKSKVISFKPAA